MNRQFVASYEDTQNFAKLFYALQDDPTVPCPRIGWQIIRERCLYIDLYFPTAQKFVARRMFRAAFGKEAAVTYGKNFQRFYTGVFEEAR